MRRDVMDINDTMESQVRVFDEENCHFLSGSTREGFRLKESDMDFMYWPDNHRVIWESSQSQYYNTHRQTLILCDCSYSPPGFTLIYLLSPSKNRGIQDACVKMNNRHYISSSKYKQIKCSASQFLSSIPHGPCTTGIYNGIEFDFAHCLVCDSWPPSAISWIDRCHSWPPRHVVDDIVKNGCHFVAIGHKLGYHERNEWRISFSLAEQKRVHAMNHCQFLTYGLLKLFLKEIINIGVDDDDKLLCSYHMKTAVFWAIQQNTIPHWCPQNLIECFWVCFKLILKWVYEGVCPNFFIRRNNMFLSKIYGNAQHHLFNRLYELCGKGFAFLLHSPSIRPYIIGVLYNPRLIVCTDEYTLVSEIEIDVSLFKDIYKYDEIEFNQQIIRRFQHALEKMIGLPHLTKCHAVMLQKLTVSFLHETAFILYLDTKKDKNKLRYRSDIICRHMLKFAAKFGCITDMLYEAMYFYKTRRYMEALFIIEMIKGKLKQPYVIFRNANEDMYIEAVGGQPWSTKLRKTIAWNMKLYNQIHYIEELMPEQMSGIQNNEISLTIPPLIMLYMLEILCSRYIDTIRVQTALDELQTLVHHDERQLISPHLRDISWQILGICQQVTENLPASLYSYKQSLKQEQKHKLHTATEKRIQQICQKIRNH